MLIQLFQCWWRIFSTRLKIRWRHNIPFAISPLLVELLNLSILRSIFNWLRTKTRLIWFPDQMIENILPNFLHIKRGCSNEMLFVVVLDWKLISDDTLLNRLLNLNLSYSLNNLQPHFNNTILMKAMLYYGLLRLNRWSDAYFSQRYSYDNKRTPGTRDPWRISDWCIGWMSVFSSFGSSIFGKFAQCVLDPRRRIFQRGIGDCDTLYSGSM